MTVYLDERIAPSRSLSPTGLRVVVLVTAAANLAICVFMLSLRAWLAPPFLGIDVLLLWWALRANHRAALDVERVTVTAEAIKVVEERPGRPDKPVWTSQTAFTHVLIEAAGQPEVRVSLALRQRRWTLAAAMSTPEREAFGRQLQAAVWAARRERHAPVA